jgi:chemotaxis protein MotB
MDENEFETSPSETDPSNPDGTETEEGQRQEYYGSTRNSGGGAGERRSYGHLWLISYSDFMTILMIFFLGMYGYTVMAKEVLRREKNQTKPATEFSMAVNELNSKFGNQVHVVEDVSKTVLELPSAVLFPSGRSELNRRAKETLAEFAKTLKLVPGDLIVEGHTDDVPIHTERFKSNWDLSVARAFSVVEVLESEGVPPERLAAWGFGENRPKVANTDEINRSRNRRIEIVLLKKERATTGG